MENENAARRAKAEGVPVGKSWGISGGGSRVVISHPSADRWRVVYAWLVGESYAQDATDYTTPMRAFAGCAHVGWIATYPTRDSAVAEFLRLADSDGRADPCDAACDVEQFRAG